jgi:hypothetical protein
MEWICMEFPNGDCHENLSELHTFCDEQFINCFPWRPAACLHMSNHMLVVCKHKLLGYILRTRARTHTHTHTHMHAHAHTRTRAHARLIFCIASISTIPIFCIVSWCMKYHWCCNRFLFPCRLIGFHIWHFYCLQYHGIQHMKLMKPTMATLSQMAISDNTRK